MRKTAIFPLAIWGRFQFFSIGKGKCPLYFYFRFIWPTDLASVPRVEPSTLIISTKFEVDTTIHRRVTALLVRIRYVTLWPWPTTISPWTVVKHGWSRGQPLHQVWRYTPIRCWLMSYDVRHRPPLTMRLEPLRVRRITWPVRRGQILRPHQ